MAGDGAVTGENQIKLSLKDTAGNTINNISFLTPGYVHVDYQDPAGNPIANRLVSFELNDSALATFIPNSGTALTDADGSAVIKVVAANKEGAGTVNVAIDEQETVGINFYSKGDAGVSGTASITAQLVNSAGTEVTTISNASPGRIVTTLLDASGNPQPNKVVSFSLTSAEHGIFNPASGTALTDASGVASIQLRTSNIETATTANISTESGVNTSISFYMQGDGTSQNVNSLTLQLVDNAGNPLSIVSNNSPAILLATYLNADGQALSGQLATFTTGLGKLSVPSAVTNSSGVANVNLTAGQIAGGAIVSVSINGQTASLAFETLGDEPSGNSVELSLKDASGLIISQIEAATPGYLHVNYSDAQGNPIANKVVSFDIDDEALATFVPNSSTALTDASGEAVIKLVAANKQGASTVTANIVNEQPVSLGFSSKGDGLAAGVAALSVKLVNAAGADITTISSAQPGFLEVTYSDTNGVGLPNEVITFALNDSSVGVFDPASASALTNASGVARIKLLTANVETAASVLVSSSTGISTSISFYMQGDGVAVGTNNISVRLIDSAGSALSVISNATPGIIEATYLDLDGLPLAGKLVSFTAGLGKLSSANAVTNASGIATVNLTAGQVSGAAIATVTAESSTASVAYETIGDEPNPIDAYSLSIVVEDSLGAENRNISQSKPGYVFATLLKDGMAVPNELIQFTIIGQGQINPTSGHALTDASGVAKVNLLTGLVEGAGTIEAAFVLGTEILTNSFNYSVVGDAPGGDGENLTLSIELFDATTGLPTVNVSQASPGRARVYLVDRDNNPVPGAVISYTSSLGEFLPAVGTALTNNAGQAEILITAGTVEGAATITASYDVATANISFTTAGDDIDAVAADPSISFEIYDCNDAPTFDKALKNFEVCSVTDNITNQRPGILGAIVKLEGSNQPLKQVLVSAGTTLGAISPASATAITNADGKAVLDLYSNGDVGAGEVSLKVKQVTSTKAFEIGRVDISLEVSTYIGTNTLPAGGSTVIEVTVKDPDNNVETSQPFTLEFSSQCMAAGNSVIDSPVVTNAGKGFATYRSINCEGTDTVTVSAITGASTVTATTDITVNTISVGSIQFVSASPTEIALKVSGGLDSNAGNRSETSQVAFRLLNEVGQAAASQRVCFELSTEVGGMILTPAPIADDFANCPNFPKAGDPEYPTDLTAPNKYAVAYTDANGDVSVTVRSGTVPTPVKVFAVWQDAADPTSEIIANVSDSLTVTTGLADFNSFSLAASILNPEGWSHDGETVTFTIRSADHFNNPVPEGTVINFRTEGGSVGASCQTVGRTGACDVEWTSQNPRPFDQTSSSCPQAFNGSLLPPCTGTTLAGYLDGTNSVIVEPRPGRATITAYAIGEESFVDLNGNGLFDSGEPTEDKSEAFTDHNEDGQYRGGSAGSVEEEFVDFNNNGSFDLGDGLYTGILCAAGSEASCTNTGIDNYQAQLNVFRNLPIVMSGSVPYGRLVDIDNAGNITPADDIDLTTATGEASQTVYLFVSDLNNNTLPFGTTISASKDNGELSGTTSFTVGSNNSNRPLLYSFTLTREASPNQKAIGFLTITVTTPLGEPTSYTVNVRDDG
ncbi:beta strand repeat-containing protein [Shewanella basaltis]|uniref:beta strand repeat-containing protein n=1 Tax=Shewanella basaltis TaxID=472183 RepID=UPI003AB0F041